MDSDKYLEGQSMQIPPLFECDSFIYWKNRFETYVKSNDLDLWHVITNNDFQLIEQNSKTKLDEVIPFEKQSDDLKKRLAKNNEAKMVIYNALPRKEYERISMDNSETREQGVRLSTSASGSQPSGNTRNDKIQQTPSSNSTNKVEAHPRNVKSSLNKRNGTKVNGSASMQNSKKHDNSDYVCINGDDCMYSDNLCVSNSMNDVKFSYDNLLHMWLMLTLAVS
ncbi:hypothetical protein Tco_0651437 [Tanacetum coccineum]|uniref:DUF4219 domain-containing protein n=1 Tax=Tanacetum coccineum TaxID=301880 RepID=A0ABQ4WUS9_9ASTR